MVMKELSRSSIEVMAPKQETFDSESNIRFTNVELHSTLSKSDNSNEAYGNVFLEAAQPEINELSGIPSIDRPRILQTARRIYPVVENWLKDYPVLSTKRLPAICLTSAAMCPNNTDEVVIEMTIFSMILIGLDDLIDDHAKYQLTTTQIRSLLKTWENVVKDGGKGSVETKLLASVNSSKFALLSAEHQVTIALAKFCQKLQTFPYAPDYYEFFIRRFSLLMNSMSQELDWQDKLKSHKLYPAYHDYLVNGRESIEAPTLMTALLIIAGPSREHINNTISNPFTQSRLLTQLEEILFSCGSSIRLTNDIGGFERELVEQKPNSVSILLHQQKRLVTTKLDEKMEQIFLKNVKDAVLREADGYQQQLEKQLERLPKALVSWGNSVLRVTSFCRDFSLAREFYTLSLEMLESFKTHLN